LGADAVSPSLGISANASVFDARVVLRVPVVAVRRVAEARRGFVSAVSPTVSLAAAGVRRVRVARARAGAAASGWGAANDCSWDGVGTASGLGAADRSVRPPVGAVDPRPPAN
jgi:hypothetical protein